MAKKVSFRPNEEGIGQLLSGPEVQKVVRRSGDAIARRAGSQFEADTWISATRGTSAKGNSRPPRAVSGVQMKPGKFPRGTRAAERLQAAREAGRV